MRTELATADPPLELYGGVAPTASPAIVVQYIATGPEVRRRQPLADLEGFFRFVTDDVLPATPPRRIRTHSWASWTGATPGPAPRYLDAHSDLVSQYFCLCPNLARGSPRDSPPLASIILALIILFRPCGGVPPYCQTQAALFAKAPGAALPPLIPREKDGR